MADQEEQPKKPQLDPATAKTALRGLVLLWPVLWPVLAVVGVVLFAIMIIASCSAATGSEVLGENISHEGAVLEKDELGAGKFINTTEDKSQTNESDGKILDEIKSQFAQLTDAARSDVLQKALGVLGIETNEAKIEEILRDGVDSLEHNLRDKLNLDKEQIDDLEDLLDLELDLDELANFLDRNSSSEAIETGYHAPMSGRRVLGGCGFAVCYGTFDTVYPAFKIDFNYEAGDLRLADREVYAVTDGEIVFAGLSGDLDIHPNGDDAGYQVLLVGDDGYVYYYAHLLPSALMTDSSDYDYFANAMKDVNRRLGFSEERDRYFFEDYLAHGRARVEAGEAIAFMGASGTVDGRMKLHFGISDILQNELNPRNRLGFYPTGPGSIRDVVDAWLANRFVNIETGELIKKLQ